MALERVRPSPLEALPLIAGGAVYFLFPSYLVFGGSVIIMALFALSLDLLTGFAGIVTLGHGVFYGLGAYSSALLSIWGMHEPVTNALAGAGFAGVVAIVSGPFVLRLRGLRLVMVTLGVASIVLEAANKLSWLTGGDDGLQNLQFSPILGRFPWTLDGATGYLYCLAWLCVGLIVARTIVASPFGVALQGIRENEARMRVLGSPVLKQLVMAYAASAFIAGLAGALSAQTNAIVTLDVLAIELSIFGLAMLVLGGIGQVYGAVLGAVVYMSVQYLTQEINASYWMFTIGALLILVVRFNRGGLLGVFAAARRRLLRGAAAT